MENFYVALETQQFDQLRTLSAPNGRQVNAFVPAGFLKSFEGSEEIARQYGGLPKLCTRLRFARTIYATDDPGYFFVEAQATSTCTTAASTRTPTLAPSACATGN